MTLSIEQCGKETNHALVPGTGFCKCTHAMFDYDPLLDVPPQEAVIERFRNEECTCGTTMDAYGCPNGH